MRRILVLVLAAAATAGCVTSLRADSEQVSLAGSHASAGAAECGNLTLALDRNTLPAGGVVNVTATMINCGTRPLAQDTPCADPGWTPQVWVGDHAFALGGGAAGNAICLTSIGHWTLAPGERMTASWSWNGTILTCCETAPHGQAQEGPVRVAPGIYVVTSTLGGWAAGSDFATHRGWSANATLEVV